MSPLPQMAPSGVKVVGVFLGADVHSPVWLGKKDAALFDLAKTLMVAKSNRVP